jgi:hypothetical protein
MPSKPRQTPRKLVDQEGRIQLAISAKKEQNFKHLPRCRDIQYA